MPYRTFFLGACGARAAHLVENLVDRLAETQVTEQTVYRMVVMRSLPQKDRTVTKLELNDRSRFQSKLFAQLYRNRELSLRRHRALHHV
jgi:hypothetical protein